MLGGTLDADDTDRIIEVWIADVFNVDVANDVMGAKIVVLGDDGTCCWC